MRNAGIFLMLYLSRSSCEKSIHHSFILIKLLVAITIITIVVTSKAGFFCNFLQFLFSKLYEEREVTIEIWSTVYIFLNTPNSIIIPRCQIFYGHLSVTVVPFSISADSSQGGVLLMTTSSFCLSRRCT